MFKGIVFEYCSLESKYRTVDHQTLLSLPDVSHDPASPMQENQTPRVMNRRAVVQSQFLSPNWLTKLPPYFSTVARSTTFIISSTDSCGEMGPVKFRLRSWLYFMKLANMGPNFSIFSADANAGRKVVSHSSFTFREQADSFTYVVLLRWCQPFPE